MKKIGLISLALVLAVGALGIGYAMWSDTVTIIGKVQTDTLCIMFTDDYGSDDDLYQDYPDPVAVYPPDGIKEHTVDAGHNYVYQPVASAKDVGYTLVDKIDDKTLEVELHYVYPSYAVKVNSHVRNCGSVPVEKGECILSYPNPAGGAPIEVPLPDYQWVTMLGPGLDANGNPGTYGVIEIAWQNGTGAQLDPHSWGGVADEEDSFYIHVLQPALQSHTYTFTITREAWNWNE